MQYKDTDLVDYTSLKGVLGRRLEFSQVHQLSDRRDYASLRKGPIEADMEPEAESDLKKRILDEQKQIEQEERRRKLFLSDEGYFRMHGKDFFFAKQSLYRFVPEHNV